MNRFYDRYVRLNHAVLRADEPGDEGVKPVSTSNSDLPDDPWDALEKAGDSFSAELDALRAADQQIPSPETAPSTPAAGEHSPPIASEPVAGAAPSPQPPQVPDQWYELQRQQTEALKALAESRTPAPPPQQQQQQPKLPDLPEDLFEDWRAPQRAANVGEDQYAYDVVRSMTTHAARKGFDLARERTRAEVLQEVQPVIQYVQQQQMNQLWQRYYGELDQAVGAAGYAKGTNQHQMVAQAVNGLAMQYANMGNQVSPQWLRDAAKTYTKYLPPQSGPQGVVDDKPAPEAAPLTGSAPAGAGAPSAPPSVETQPSKNLDDANANFQADLNRLFGGRRAG